jgi:hypothetical protein
VNLRVVDFDRNDDGGSMDSDETGSGPGRGQEWWPEGHVGSIKIRRRVNQGLPDGPVRGH